MMHAIAVDSEPLIKRLLNAGASMTKKDMIGRRVIDVGKPARRKMDFELIEEQEKFWRYLILIFN